MAIFVAQVLRKECQYQYILAQVLLLRIYITTKQVSGPELRYYCNTAPQLYCISTFKNTLIWICLHELEKDLDGMPGLDGTVWMDNLDFDVKEENEPMCQLNIWRFFGSLLIIIHKRIIRECFEYFFLVCQVIISMCSWKNLTCQLFCGLF